jgi:hypothetical protein
VIEVPHHGSKTAGDHEGLTAREGATEHHDGGGDAGASKLDAFFYKTDRESPRARLKRAPSGLHGPVPIAVRFDDTEDAHIIADHTPD